MESDPDKLFHVLDNGRVGTRFSKFGFACMCIFQFAHGMGIYTLNNTVAISGECFGLTDYQMRILFIVHFANSYVSPFFAALFADLTVGKYSAIIFSAGMRLFATVILMAIAVVFQFTDKTAMHPILKSSLFGIYIFGLMFLFVSMEFATSLLFPFGMQQVNQESGMAVTSAARWMLWFGDLGTVSITLVAYYLRDRFKSYHMIVENAMSLVVACIMISVFILGKSQYNRRTTDDGKASFVAILKIIKTRFCCRSRYSSLDEPMTFAQDADQQYRVHQGIKMERLILRKLFLMLGFFACFGVGEVIYFKLLFLKVTGWCGRCHERHAFTAGYLTLLIYAPFLVLNPILECIKWRKNANGNLASADEAGVVNFKSMGAGLVMAAIAVLIAALFCHFKNVDDFATWKSMWLIPAFLTLGFMPLLTFVKAVEFCYTESFKGLECFTTSLMCTLWMFLTSVITWTEVKWRHDLYNVEIFLYALCGAMVGTILFIFIPVTIWYNRVKAEIAEATTSFRNSGYDSLMGSNYAANAETGERDCQSDWFDDSDEVAGPDSRLTSSTCSKESNPL